ncbi:unnamed protein product [Haemonchus placei]|uniref:Alternative protein n=1 Tax=Haemonchus placei TaxID=6290 RepID=A0A0N4VWG2_HAEPC|nr:unnamed protein product [Haemonchus placei]
MMMEGVLGSATHRAATRTKASGRTCDSLMNIPS